MLIMWLKPNVALDAKKDWSIADSGALLEATALNANMRASADDGLPCRWSQGPTSSFEPTLGQSS